MLRLKLELKEKSLQFRLRARPPDKRIFSPLTVAGLCVTIGRYSVQAFNGDSSRSILPIRTHSGI
jgi:hypothetical protein